MFHLKVTVEDAMWLTSLVVSSPFSSSLLASDMYLFKSEDNLKFALLLTRSDKRKILRSFQKEKQNTSLMIKQKFSCLEIEKFNIICTFLKTHLSGMNIEPAWAEPGTAHFFCRDGCSLSLMDLSCPLDTTIVDSFCKLRWMTLCISFNGVC